MSLLPFEVPIGFARIAVERGIDRHPDGLTYAVPPDLADLEPGERVLVPLGRGDRLAAGYVVELIADPAIPRERLKPIDRRDDAGSRLPATLLRLAAWIAGYYCAPIGMTLATMIPAAVKRNVGAQTRLLLDLADAPATDDAPSGESAVDSPPGTTKPTPKQRKALAVLAAIPAAQRPVEIRDLADRAGLRTTGPLKRLLEAGHLRAVRRTSVEARWAEHAATVQAPPRLTAAQQGVVAAITATIDAGFSAHLLHGVTGSGKTEVYIRLIEETLARGRIALVLVPEIALTPQTGGRLIGRFPGRRVAILHSGLTAAQRHQQWDLVMRGEASIVLGARSAVFAPIPAGRLGLIVVDEEHDASFKQDQLPRYHGRDVALRRAQLEACPIVLGSATPALESWHNAHGRGAWHLHRLTERAPGMRLPHVAVVDFAEERKRRVDRRVHLIGPTLEAAMGAALARGGQAILLLNRRGYANWIACPDQTCGWTMRCAHCDASMVYHRDAALPTGGFVRCHHCLTEQRLPLTCPDCGKRVTTFGLGTQRVEEELARKFGLVTGRDLLRLDSDTMRTARDYHAALDAFGSGAVKVLVGTQMIAKGLDFPDVEVVGVVNADTAIHMPDFRAAERTFQLVSQVAGRSGRRPDGASTGRVVVQTFNPDVPAIALAAQHDYEGFARRELAERERCGLPPFARMARVVLRDEDADRADARAAVVADGLRFLAAGSVAVHGPAPCPIARIANFHRRQVELLAPDAATMQRLLAAARNRDLLRSDAGMAVDVDPVALL